jgi:hypothetical protein
LGWGEQDARPRPVRTAGAQRRRLTRPGASRRSTADARVTETWQTSPAQTRRLGGSTPPTRTPELPQPNADMETQATRTDASVAQWKSAGLRTRASEVQILSEASRLATTAAAGHARPANARSPRDLPSKVVMARAQRAGPSTAGHRGRLVRHAPAKRVTAVRLRPVSSLPETRLAP